MKIAFWSHTREGACVTTNLACMAAMTAVHSEKKCMLLENHYSLRNIGDLMLPSERIECLREQGQYYNKYGLEHLLKELYSGKNDANDTAHSDSFIVSEFILFATEFHCKSRCIQL